MEQNKLPEVPPVTLREKNGTFTLQRNGVDLQCPYFTKLMAIAEDDRGRMKQIPVVQGCSSVCSKFHILNIHEHIHVQQLCPESQEFNFAEVTEPETPTATKSGIITGTGGKA